MPLTDTAVKALKWGGKPTGEKYSDGGGLFLHVTKSGKYWRQAYRVTGKQKLLAHGSYPAVSLAQARKARDAAKELLAAGQDPGEAKRTAKAQAKAEAGNTFDIIAREWLAGKKKGWSATHYEREQRNVEKDLIPAFGKRVIGTIKATELLAVVKKVEARGAATVAQRMIFTARGIWVHAILTGRAPHDITSGLSKGLAPRVKRNFPAIVDPMQLGQLLRAIADYTGGPVVRTALQIAAVLFQRPGNLRTMRWADIDMKAAVWTIPAADLKGTLQDKATGDPHLVPLPKQVIKLLEDLRPFTGRYKWVFPGFRDQKRPMSEVAVTAALHGLGYRGIQSWHGFRASGRTLIREMLKYDADILEVQLAHNSHVGHAGAYDRARFLEERTAMLQAWADLLDKLRDGAEIVPFGLKKSA